MPISQQSQPSQLPPAQTPDAVWSDLRLSVLWAQGFSLCLLYSDAAAPLLELRRRLADALLVQTRRLVVLEFAAADELLPGVMNALLGEAAAAAHQQTAAITPVWVQASAYGGDEAWDRARRLLLARMNERRYLLERDFKCPLILALPRSFRSLVRELSPDLWHVRTYSVVLTPSERPESALISTLQKLPQHETGTANTIGDASQSPVVKEWQRLKSEEAQRVSPSLGWAAFEAAQEAGDWKLALAIAGETLALSRRRLAAGGDKNTLLRDLSVSLENVGQVSGDLGQLTEAKAAYVEMLELTRQLRASLGDSPQVLRDLSVSLNNVGQVSRDLGQLNEAKTAYAESLELRRQLRASLGDSPQVLRDLGLSLVQCAQILQAEKDADAASQMLDEAQSCFEKALIQSPHDAALAKILAALKPLREQLRLPK